jgi:hypothetical protein
MATSQTLLQEDSIIAAAMDKFIDLGQEASERIVNGMTPEKEDEKAEQILQLLTAYRRRDQLSDDNLESLLLALKMLSGGNNMPTVEPVVGQSIVYRLGTTSSSGGGSGDPRPTFDAYNPVSGSPPSAGSGDLGAIKKGDGFYSTDGTPGAGDGTPIGNVFGQGIYKGCLWYAKTDGASTRAEWWLSQDGY